MSFFKNACFWIGSNLAFEKQGFIFPNPCGIPGVHSFLEIIIIWPGRMLQQPSFQRFAGMPVNVDAVVPARFKRAKPCRWSGDLMGSRGLVGCHGLVPMTLTWFFILTRKLTAGTWKWWWKPSSEYPCTVVHFQVNHVRTFGGEYVSVSPIFSGFWGRFWAKKFQVFYALLRIVQVERLKDMLTITFIFFHFRMTDFTKKNRPPEKRMQSASTSVTQRGWKVDHFRWSGDANVAILQCNWP